MRIGNFNCVSTATPTFDFVAGIAAGKLFIASSKTVESSGSASNTVAASSSSNKETVPSLSTPIIRVISRSKT